MAKTMGISDQCPMEIGLNVLSGKWTLRILWYLSKKAVRFNELQRLLGGITTKTLTQKLKELEKHRIVERNVLPETPPRVEYSLSELGMTIQPVLKALCDWGSNYQNEMSC